jgi:hypothetical protein
MPRDGGDLTGKLGVLRVSCKKCGRDGRYILARLIRIVAAMPSSLIGSMNLQPSTPRRLHTTHE